MNSNSPISALKSILPSRLLGLEAPRPREPESPLRLVLFTRAQLESHARRLGAGHGVEVGPGTERLLHRLKYNEGIIHESYQVVAEAGREGRQAAPAAEWLLDNYYLIRDQIEIARDHLPPGFSRELPRLRAGPLEGYPHVYALAFELVSHTDGRVDLDNLWHFVRAYQTVQPLRLGELWAVPIMLRLALIENLQRVADRTASRRLQRDRALVWVRRFLEVVHQQPKSLITELADFVRETPSMSQAFIAELATNLQGQHPALVLVINWIEQDLAERGQTIEQILQTESHDQAADRVSIGNSITSLRTLTAIDWPEFVESLSVTEAELRRDPLVVYPRMDFRTRDRYRHVVEHLTRWSPKSEPEVAATAVHLAAQQMRQHGADRRESHVGWFLIDRGLPDLQRAIGYRPPIARRVAPWFERHAAAMAVLGGGGLVAALAIPLLWLQAPGLIDYGWGWLILVGAGVLVFASQAAVSVASWLVTILVPPRSLPRLDFSKGIPDEHRTAVVIPTMLTSPEAVDDLIEGQEIRYLSNRDPNLVFVLLSDFPDAPKQVMPTDEALLGRAAEGLRRLNAKYAESDRTIFFLLHRPRLWNPVEGAWMGYERKRGKLLEFTRFLRGGATGELSVLVGDPAQVRSVKYVITLDTDTQLPPGTAHKMVGTMAHPLNRPRLSTVTGCTERGYGLLQPRVAVSLTAAGRSLFARLVAGEVGIDPYTREVSNVYHDLFAQSPFIGKGIFDVETVDRAIGGRFPDNRILSHDLIEGLYARCGYINDVELIEDHPSRYLADINRRHRWTRGDWQIASWLLRRVPGPQGKRMPNPLGRLAQWLIFDNLRRSLVPPTLLALLLAGWLALPAAAGVWTLGILAVYLLPWVLRFTWAAGAKAKKVPWQTHVRQTFLVAAGELVIRFLQLAFLVHEAVVQLDAVVRVGWRTLVTHRHLLEWQTSRDAERNARVGFAATWRAMWSQPVLAIATGAGLLLLASPATTAAAPLLGLWLAGPLVAWFVSRPLARRRAHFAEGQARFLRRLTRRSWMYFEHLAGPDQHGLPPDSFQEQPQVKVANRTSPTNIGMGLLANLVAHDFGYIPAGEVVDRTAKALATLEELPRYRGHFFNWYDTRTCRVLDPAYVSTVDSGNLACSLITLRGGLLELVNSAVIPAGWRTGIEDVAGVLLEELEAAVARADPPRAGGADLDKATAAVRDQAQPLAESPDTLPAIRAALARSASALAEPAPLCQGDGEAGFWLTAMRRQVDAWDRDLIFLAPWLADAESPPRDSPVAAWPEGVSAVAALRADLARIPTLRDLAGLDRRLGPHLGNLAARASAGSKPWADWLHGLRRSVAEASRRAVERIRSIEDLVLRCEELVETDLDFLYDQTRKLLSIGFSLETHRRDPGCYDLLASEARLCSFLAVARGRLPLEHWFLLGRQLAPGYGTPALVSWSGSMFEYLMPQMLLPTFQGSLLEQTCRVAVARHIAYGRRRGVPWGMSESCYNQVDAEMNYQYRGFGVPDLGLKRGLADDLVVAPYATVMALMVMPKEACANLEGMARQGFMGRFGFYEAVDYTPGRVPTDQPYAVVKCFMAHHTGMSLLALADVLLDHPMQRRFLADPEARAAVVLLQERVPMARPRAPLDPRLSTLADREARRPSRAPATRVYTTADSPSPDVHLLSNGRYHVMVTSAGGGYSRWQGLALTRWREDATQDPWGLFLYLQDVKDGHAWSCTQQPLGRKFDRYEAIFSQGRAEFRTWYRQTEAHTQISVSPEDDIELRRVTLTNLSEKSRTLELTSFAEVVLAEPRAELSHPVFNGLFIQTEIVPEKSTILCTQRPRSPDTPPLWMFHAMVVHGEGAAPAVSFETDRARFIGRGRTAANPLALESPGPLSHTAGSVTDPSVAVRTRVHLRPGGAVTLDVVTGIGKTRDEVVALADKYRDRRLADRVFELAWTQSQVLHHQVRAGEVEAQLFTRLAGSILYAHGRYRASPSLLARNRKGQADLWRHGISGDLPIVLVRATEPLALDLVRDMIRAYTYWRYKGLQVDLVIWADAFAGYRQSLLDQIVGLVNAGPGAKVLNQPGGIFVRSTDQLPEEDRLLLQSVARVVVSDRAGTLEEQLERRRRDEPRPAKLLASRQPETRAPTPADEADLPPGDLAFFNGLGGFTPDGREYVILLPHGTATPAPWSNVLANAQFGSVVTESGGGYTWYDNAHQYRLTPWHNDPVSDPAGEAFYIRDEETGRFWSPTPRPAAGPTPYVCRHGLGYSVFEHAQNAIASEMWTYVAVDAPVKCTAITLRNRSERDRRLSVTGYCEWVLGETRDQNAMHVVTRLDPATGAILASSPYSTDFRNRVAFFQSSERDRGFTADRREFIGRNRSLAAPEAMRRQGLSGRVGAGLDPCAAIQAFVDVPAGQERQVVFILGAAPNEQEAQQLIDRFSGAAGAHQAMEAVWQFWKHLLGGVYVETPDPAVNFLANHWLLYQVLAGRFWGRTGYYQSGGAFGFRDQLQDSLAFLHECPWLTRQHLLAAAGRQFRGGDVQHWWHPPAGRGVRTGISDDSLWLPYVVSQYVHVTGDTGVLDEQAPFLEGRALEPGEESYYDMPQDSGERATLYEHCVRAIRRGLRFGSHGLPLIGTGDWNDGLNHVGRAGRGESVWLAFFLHDVLNRFAPLARSRNDPAVAQECLDAAARLKAAVEAHAWDGRWYRRAYFDDGRPLGSAESPECQIDSLPQSWAILSGAAGPERAQLAMQSALERLVDWRLGLMRLLDPPFDAAPWDPGYIKGYVPGLRENGAQYTHAAIWVVMALASLRQGEQAWRLFSAISPIHHGDSPERIATYRVEPYVVAADVYTAKGCEGRGGWTWYTGSAAWMYRLLIENLLGLSRQVDTLTLAPLLPEGWKEYAVHYRFYETVYHIHVTVAGPATWNVRSVSVDGAEQPDRRIHLADDHQEHAVSVEVG